MTAFAKVAGVPARFDAANQRRRSLIAKAKVAAKELRLTEDEYRQALVEQTGEWSCRDCSVAQLEKLIAHFKSRGFTSKPKVGTRKAADHPSARKARALWISLHHLGAIDNPSERALEAFAQRQLKVAALQWADQGQCYKLVEALKAMAQRHGWDCVGDIRAIKQSLIEALRRKLVMRGLAGADWPIHTLVRQLLGIEAQPYLGDQGLEQLTEIATALGVKLRESGL